MIAAARRRLPDVRFEVADIAALAGPGASDLIFANAVLQWLPDHAALLPPLAGAAGAGRQRSRCRCPTTSTSPPHRLMREVAGEGPWAGQLARRGGRAVGAAPAGLVLAAAAQAAAQVEVWRTTYFHPLPAAPPG